MKLKITNVDGYTTLTDPDTGVAFEGVRRVTWEHDATGYPLITLQGAADDDVELVGVVTDPDEAQRIALNHVIGLLRAVTTGTPITPDTARGAVYMLEAAFNRRIDD